MGPVIQHMHCELQNLKLTAATFFHFSFFCVPVVVNHISKKWIHKSTDTSLKGYITIGHWS